MAHEKRKPSAGLIVDVPFFNKMLGILDFHINTKINDENFSLVAEKLKSKILRYSVPRVNDYGEEFVDIRFFPNESVNMIWQLLVWAKDPNSSEDYFSILKQTREDRK